MRTALALAGLAAGLMTVVGGAESAYAAAPTCDGQRATLVGSTRDDVLRGTAGRDVIVGLGGNDRLLGLGGDDVLCGGDGYDVLEGGAGDDRLYGQRDAFGLISDDEIRGYVGDRLAGGAGDDLLDGGRDRRGAKGFLIDGPETYDVLDFSGAPQGVTVDLGRGTASGEGDDTIVDQRLSVLTTRFDDTVVGGKRPIRAVTGAGDDTVTGSRGADLIEADARSTRQFNARKDPAIGNGGDDTVDGGGGKDSISGSKGLDTIRGGNGADNLSWRGTIGPSLLDGGAGEDAISTEKLLLTSATTITFGPGDHAGEALRLVLSQRGALAWDLATGVVLVDGQDLGARLGHAGRIDITGRRGGDPLTVTVSGTPGDDDVRSNVPAVFRGLGGNDRFGGSPFADTFDGGEGTDTYRGDASPTSGANTCVSVEADRGGACAA